MFKLELTPKKYIEDKKTKKKIFYISKYQNQRYSIRFEKETDNKFDPNAVKVFMKIGIKKPEEYFIGYVSKNSFSFNEFTNQVETTSIPSTNNLLSLNRILLEKNWKYFESSDYERWLETF